MNPSLRIFAMSLLENINLGLFDQTQIFQFVRIYALNKNKSVFSIVLQNLLSKRS
jgi:hypothetical protein